MAAKLPVPVKRPIRQLSAREKLDAIQRVHNGESKASVARDIGVPESTLRGWCKSEDKLRNVVLLGSTEGEDKEVSGPSERKKTDTKGLDEDPLGQWLLQQQQNMTTGFHSVGPFTGAAKDSWFWRWYKHNGFAHYPENLGDKYNNIGSSDALQSIKNYSVNNIGNKSPLDNNHVRRFTEESDDEEEEDEPPATTAEAVKHGEKFLRWLECCSDPSITAMQILQFRYLLNNVRDCADRKAKQSKSQTSSRRK